MGRKKQWDERLNLTLPEGAKARIDEVLEDGEDRYAMVRSSIETEIRKRHRRRDRVRTGMVTPDEPRDNGK